MLQRDFPDPGVKVLATLVYLSLVLVSLCANIGTAVVFFVGHRYFLNRPFYIVARHLLVTDLLSTFAQLLVAVAVSALPFEVTKRYASTSIYEYFITLETVGQVATFHFVLCQAFTQVAPFLPRGEDIVQYISHQGTFICMGVWFFNAAFLLLFYAANCGKVFDPVTLYFFYVCNETLNDNSITILVLIKIWFGATLFTSFMIYVIGLRTVFRKFRTFRRAAVENSTTTLNNPHGSSSTSRRKTFQELHRLRLVLIQGMLVTLFSVVRMLGFFGVPAFSRRTFTGVDSIASINIVGNALALLCIASRPFVYAAFNERIRKLYAQLLSVGKKKRKNSVSR